MYLFEGHPGQLGACFGDGAAMNCLCIGPQSAAAGMAEKGTGFAINALILAAGDKR
jgi:hypothetical protein